MQKIEQNGVLLVMIIVVLFSDVIGQVMSGCIRVNFACIYEYIWCIIGAYPGFIRGRV